MQINDQITARGIFHILVFRQGKLVLDFEEENLIVDKGRNSVTKLLGGDGVNLHIAKIGFGTSGAVAEPGNLALTDSFIKALDSHSYPTATSVQFSFSLAANEANGKDIREFGLLTNSGLLFARKVRASSGLMKDSDMTLSGTWRLLY